MQYMGGKTKIAKPIAQFIMSNIPEGFNGLFFEPFFGSGAITYELMNQGFDASYYASDSLEDLILMYQAIQEGWIPHPVDEKEYRILKYSTEPSPQRAFTGFALSFAGRFFEGYARNNGRGDNYYQAGVNSIERRRSRTEKINFSHKNYVEVCIPENSVVYCDPPYNSRKRYAQGKFDSEEFFEWAREISQHSQVYISEYQAPEDFECVFEIERKLGLRSHKGCETRIEKIFTSR